jgi:hypothetical protein
MLRSPSALPPPKKYTYFFDAARFPAAGVAAAVFVERVDVRDFELFAFVTFFAIGDAASRPDRIRAQLTLGFWDDFGDVGEL